MMKMMKMMELVWGVVREATPIRCQATLGWLDPGLIPRIPATCHVCP